MIRWGAAVALVLGAVMIVAVGPADAQQAASGATPAVRQQRLVLQLPPADIAATAALGPPLDRPGQNPDCAPAWPCRLRLFGVIEKYGGVGLKAPVLTW